MRSDPAEFDPPAPIQHSRQTSLSSSLTVPSTIASYRWTAASTTPTSVGGDERTPGLSIASSRSSSVYSMASAEHHPAAAPIAVPTRRSSSLTCETKSAIPTIARRDTVTWWLGMHAGEEA